MKSRRGKLEEGSRARKYQKIQKERKIAWIIFNNPEHLNRIPSYCWLRVSDLVKQAEADDDVKVIIFKFKSKVRYRRKKGHHQLFTRLSIDKIVPPGAAEAKPVKRTRRKKEVTKDGA
jgi:hypothetical protein